MTEQVTANEHKPRSVSTGAPAVEVEHLTKRYGTTVAVEDVSCEVARGEIFGIL